MYGEWWDIPSIFLDFIHVYNSPFEIYPDPANCFPHMRFADLPFKLKYQAI